MLPKGPTAPRGRGTAGWCIVFALVLLNVCTAAWYLISSGGIDSALHVTHSCPPPPCLDVLIVYHEDDRQMLIDNGALDSAMQNLVGIRTFFILSASNATFRHYFNTPGRRVRWLDEARAPFTRQQFEGAKRPAGWLYQQALKLYTIAHAPELCNDVMVLDSDVLWLREFDVRAHPPPVVESSLSHESLAVSVAGGRRTGEPASSVVAQPGAVASHCPITQRYKYCLSSMDSGAWYGDITNGEYHHFINWFLGLPKVLANSHTAINNWQVMQRDVVQAIEAGLQDRGLGSLQQAIQQYGKTYNGMSEYEAYFSFLWTRYRDRIEPVYLPWILRKPSTCNFNDKATMQQFQNKSVIMYFTCHDNYGADDYYINCKGRENKCDPALFTQ